MSYINNYIKSPDFTALLNGVEEQKESERASGYHKRLIEMITAFDNSLDNEHEVGMKLVTFGQAVTFHVTGIGYYNPSLIRFLGRLEDGSSVELIQHISQISFLLMAVKRSNPDEPKKPIGFIS
ncbi:DUF6173 family protein [Brevibacillus choshinensis]|uniref:Uncharacterized protein n=1 Tax=Brevibacillus choshinensis TaxID=54911 RepID=A0ABX7FM70_BRECH|nr:DUF6173 family protein [Brevibacillus choshinensis]QRG66945.1 hypothetical protein JNE38_26285 [Brevibacillus choshinensis]